jgi:hypothetical protein
MVASFPLLFSSGSNEDANKMEAIEQVYSSLQVSQPKVTPYLLVNTLIDLASPH